MSFKIYRWKNSEKKGDLLIGIYVSQRVVNVQSKARHNKLAQIEGIQGQCHRRRKGCQSP